MNNMKNKILKCLAENETDFPINSSGYDFEDVEMAFHLIQDELNLDFAIDLMGGEDAYLSSSYYSKKIGHTVIIDYDIPSYFESVEDIIKTIKKQNKKIKELELKLK